MTVLSLAAESERRVGAGLVEGMPDPDVCVGAVWARKRGFGCRCFVAQAAAPAAADVHDGAFSSRPEAVRAGGSSRRMFKLSRIHIESVRASARESRFHAASSFG